MSDEYKELVKASRKKLSRIRFITEVEVLKAYKVATYNISKKIEDNQRRGLQTAYYENIYADLDEMAEVLENRLTKAIESGVYATVEIATGVQVMMNELFFPPEISSMANGYLRDLNYKYVKTFLAGGLYDDGKGLSDRIWEKTQKNCEDIRTLISSNIAQGANSRELARKLNNYVNPTQMTKAETIVSGMDRDIAYQAQRLARTSLTHIANETDRQNAKENVFCKGMKWNLSSSHYERQVKRWGEDICDVYANQDGYGLGKGVFPVEEYPIAHPNCLCYSTQVQPSLDDIINRVNNWVDGSEDEELEKGYQKWKSGETAFQDLYSSTKPRTSNKSPKDDFYTRLSKKPPNEIARAMRNKNQYERYINVLGKDNVADSLDKFMDLKYNNSNAYKDLQGFYKYKNKNPNSDRMCYDIHKEFKELGFRQNKVLLPNKEKAYILPDDNHKDKYHIMKRMKSRNITDDEVRGYHQNAKVQVSQWQGKSEIYYTNEGVTIVHNSYNGTRLYNTVFRKEDFDEDTLKKLEVINKYANKE